MPVSRGPIHEDSYSISPELAEEFDAWLFARLDAMRNLEGVEGARSLDGGVNVAGRMHRVLQVHFADEATLERYLSEPPEPAAEPPFGDEVGHSSRILRDMDAGAAQPVETCLNCGAVLGGQYCGSCGQRARSRLISIWELLKEAFGDLFELDSRLWRTLIPLASRPGRLTRDYLEGRRARYMPPFRTYLVLSIVFFLVAFFDPREQFSIFFAAEEAPAASPPAGALSTTPAPGAGQTRQPAIDDLADQGIMPESDTAAVSGTVNAEEAPEPSTEEPSTSPGFNIRFANGGQDTSGDCDNLEMENAPPWLSSRVTPERLKLICERATANGGTALVSRILDNTPAALIFLLPLMALILKILYPLSKRYYVEHLLFIVHYHAFIFLILTLQTILNRLVSTAGLPATIASIGVAVVFFYVPIYLYLALRRVYAQGRLLSSLKFFVLLLSYCVGLSLIFVIVLLFSAFSI